MRIFAVNYETWRVDRDNKKRLDQSTRRKAGKALEGVLKQTYFKGLPTADIVEALESAGIVPLDGEEAWSGMIQGMVQDEHSERRELAWVTGEAIPNSLLILNFHKMPVTSINKWEVTGYLS